MALLKAVPQEEFVTCICAKKEHIIRISFNVYNKGDVELEAAVYLSHYLGFWRRLWLGVKYIFGSASCDKSHFDVVLFNPSNAKNVRRLLDKFIFESTYSKKKKEGE